MRVPFEWIQEFVATRHKPERLASMLTMCGLEVEDIERIGGEVIYEIGVTPNRADCLSVIGIAREVAAVTKGSLRIKWPGAPRGKGRIGDFVRISVKHKGACPRYSARIVDGVEIGPSPSWIVKRLAACGIRSINNVVDATNYVMLETGQPTHAFDTRFIRSGKINVRKAGDGTKFTTLDGIERDLKSEDLLICDGEGPVAIAGIMGGENSEVRRSTKQILLESACFESTSIRRTSRRLGLASESSRRFERGVDPNGAVDALNRLTWIIAETAGGTPTSDWVDIYPERVRPKRLKLTVEETKRILGVDVGLSELRGYLRRLGLGVANAASSRKGRCSGGISVTVPTFRRDLERDIDLIEEIARIRGYGSIGETMPAVRMKPLSRPRFSNEEDMVRESLAARGLTETVLYGFTSEASLEPFKEIGGVNVKITNPLSQDQGAMRTTLIPGLLDIMNLNASRQRSDCRIFALQNIYHRPVPVGQADERKHVAGAMSGRRFPLAWERSGEMLDFYDAKGVVEGIVSSLGLGSSTIYQRGEAYSFLHPGQFARVICSGKRLGFVGLLHPAVSALWDLEQRIFVFELNFELLAEIAIGETPRFRELSRFPFVERDLAVVLPDRVPAVEVEKAIQDSGVDLIEDVRIFDVYRGKGIADSGKSVGVTIRFARNDRTLTDDEVGSAQRKIVDALQTKLGATLRT